MIHECRFDIDKENYCSLTDTIICRCNLSCWDTGHYHCPTCSKTIVRKDLAVLHLTACCKKQTVKREASPTKQSLESETDDVMPRDSGSVVQQSVPSASVLTLDHQYARNSSVSRLSPQSTPTISSSELPSSRVTSLKSVKCPICSAVLYKKNLGIHIQRKHERTKDITAEAHLKGVCVDKSRGLYAVSKRSHGFSVPIHVQRKDWGKQHVIKCELEDCRQYQLLALRSGLAPSTCDHIRSLDYCSNTVTEEPLKHDVLEEMVECKFFGDSKVAACKKRKKEAEEACAPLSLLVELGGSQNRICLSIHEPKIYHYSCLGRVVVTYDVKKNTWHCPCAKARTSCPHKNIGKWHLFQTRKELFATAPPTPGTLPETTYSVSSPPAAPMDMDRSVRYLYEKKKIPATLPGDATTLRALTEYPSKLIPAETTCQLCPGNPDLEETLLITHKAKIVGMNGVMESM